MNDASNTAFSPSRNPQRIKAAFEKGLGLVVDVIVAVSCVVWCLSCFCCCYCPPQLCGTRPPIPPYEAFKREYKGYVSMRKKYRPLPLPSRRRSSLSSPPGRGFANLINLALERDGADNPQLQSLFLTKLSPDLRLMIYEEVLGGSMLHIIQFEGRNPQDLNEGPNSGSSLHRNLEFDLFYRRLRLKRLDFEPCMTGDLAEMGMAKDYGWIHTSYWRWLSCVRLQDGLCRYLALPAHRENGPLSLLKTKRNRYREAVNVLYSYNTFSFQHTDQLFDFSATILPARLNVIRSLNLHFVFRWYGDRKPWDRKTWQRTCTLLDGMHGLTDLKVLLGECHNVEHPSRSWALPLLRNVHVNGKFMVYVSWPESPEEKDIGAENWPFILLRPPQNWWRLELPDQSYNSPIVPLPALIRSQCLLPCCNEYLQRSGKWWKTEVSREG